MDFPRDVCVFNDHQKFAVSVFLVQEGDGTLLNVALRQQMFLRKDTHRQQLPKKDGNAQQLVRLHEKNEPGLPSERRNLCCAARIRSDSCYGTAF